MRKIIGIGILATGLVASSFAATRVGPVSQYGQLLAGKNASGEGRIYGSCKGVSSGNEVAVQGMSFFWSGDGAGSGADLWTKEIVLGLVSNQKIQLVRGPMSVDETGWSGSDHYFKNESYYQGVMDRLVQSAIDNDIYVLIDFHSHCAENSTENAKTFFSYMAQKWGKYDNVIFEVYNEPVGSGCSKSWIKLDDAKSYWTSSIKPYAESVIAVIRQYSDNLVVVGTPYYDQYPNAALASPINDKNVAYTFHYYAGEDQYKHTVSDQGNNAVLAMNGGLSVFVTEWGNSSPDGGAGKNGADLNSAYSTEWYNWMKTYKLSGANWAISKKDESASYFTTAGAWNYSTSGAWVNANVFASLPETYTACDGNAATSSSSIVSSSSSVVLPEGYTDYIDDFEDGDSLAYTGGIWYAYTDVGDNGASSISNTKIKDANGGDSYDVVVVADDSSNYMGAITGINLSQGGNKYDPYVALGVMLNADGTAYDLSQCKTISYKYKGAAHNFKVEDEKVSDYGFHQIEKYSSSNWTTVNINWSSLLQPSWAAMVDLSKSRISKFTWEVKGNQQGTQPSPNYLYVDDVRCDGMSIKKMSSSSDSSNTPLVTTFAVTSGNDVQSVTAGEAITPIVYSFENVTNIKATLVSSLTGKLDTAAKTYTISGTLDKSLQTKDYEYIIEVTGVNENKIVKGTFKVTRALVVTSVTLASGGVEQSVMAGESIRPVVFRYENALEIRTEGMPKGITATLDQNARTCTISGTLDSTLGTKDYEISAVVTGLDNNDTATSVIKVTRRPVETTFELVNDNSVQSVMAGNAIEDIVYYFKNINTTNISGLPKGLTVVLDTAAKTYSIKGVVDSALSTYDYNYTIKVTGIDENMTVTGSIKVTRRPVVTVFDLTSGNAEQTVKVGEAIEPIVYSYKNVKDVKVSELPRGLEASFNQDARTFTISGTVDASLSTHDYEFNIAVVGMDENTSATCVIHVVAVLHSSSSEEPEVSSSSEEPEVSSSSVEPEVSSSSEEPEVSSSSEEPEVSSSSEEPEVSSSSVEPEVSSSSEIPPDAIVAAIRPMFSVGFARNVLTISANNARIKIQIFDMMGHVVESRSEHVLDNFSASFGHLNRGNYIVRLSCGSQTKSTRIIVK